MRKSEAAQLLFSHLVDAFYISLETIFYARPMPSVRVATISVWMYFYLHYGCCILYCVLHNECCLHVYVFVSEVFLDRLVNALYCVMWIRAASNNNNNNNNNSKVLAAHIPICSRLYRTCSKTSETPCIWKPDHCKHHDLSCWEETETRLIFFFLLLFCVRFHRTAYF